MGGTSSRQRMVEAIRKLAALKPLSAVTVKEIAAESGVSERTFYNHFRDKFDLISTEMAEEGDRVFQRELESGTFYGYLHGITLAYKQLSPEYMANVSRASTNNSFLQRDLDNQEGAAHRHLRDMAGQREDFADLRFQLVFWHTAMLRDHRRWYTGELNVAFKDMIRLEVARPPEALRPYFDFPALRGGRLAGDGRPSPCSSHSYSTKLGSAGLS